MARGAVEEAQAEALFERPHQCAERRLREVACGCGAREAALLGQGQEGVDVAAGEVHS